MITVFINEAKFEYDIHSLVKAFYPKENVKVLLKGEFPDLVKEKEEDMVFEIRFASDLVSMYYENGEMLYSLPILSETERAGEKNIVKRLVYLALSKHTGKTLVWGDLTGIRPTKIARTLLDEGKKDDEILAYMKETYLVSDEKALLSIDIAKRERSILSKINYEKGYSLYIGIPFCPTTCLYCSFTSNPVAKWRKRVSDYLDALIKEIEFVGQARKDKVLDTIYIGGGTPTTLEPDELTRLFEAIRANFDLSNLLEFTVEAGRADSITREKLEVLKKYGVDRISVNPQTMNQKTLDIIGRRHTVEDVERAYWDARELGFSNINMDIILGLPGEDIPEVQRTIDRIVELSPDSLTVHSLAIKRGSKLSEWILQNGYDTMVNTSDTMEIACEGAKKMGMEPYYLYRQKNMAGNFENTGYAKDGAYGIYNILIMEEVEPIVALGPGSVSKIITPKGTLERSDNVKDVALYIDSIDEMIERKKVLFSLE